MEGAHVFRAKASRTPYRRSGLVLGSASWLEFDARELDQEKILALLADPVVSLQHRVGGQWVSPSAEERQAAQHLPIVGEPEANREQQDVNWLRGRLNDVTDDLASANVAIEQRGEEIAALIDGNQDLRDALADADRRIAELAGELELANASAVCWRKATMDIADVEGLDLPEAWRKSIATLSELDPPGTGEPHVPAKGDGSWAVPKGTGKAEKAKPAK